MKYLIMVMLSLSMFIANAQVANFFKSKPVENTVYNVKLDLTTAGSGNKDLPSLTFQVTSVFELYQVFEAYAGNFDDTDIGETLFINLRITSKKHEFDFQNTDLIIATLSEYNKEDECYDYATEATLSSSEEMYIWLVGNGMKKK